jgi:hypothetical protein
MDYIDAAVDRIHHLVDRAEELYDAYMDVEAALLLEQAHEIALSIREPVRTLALAA